MIVCLPIVTFVHLVVNWNGGAGRAGWAERAYHHGRAELAVWPCAGALMEISDDAIGKREAELCSAEFHPYLEKLLGYVLHDSNILGEEFYIYNSSTVPKEL